MMKSLMVPFFIFSLMIILLSAIVSEGISSHSQFEVLKSNQTNVLTEHSNHDHPQDQQKSKECSNHHHHCSSLCVGVLEKQTVEIQIFSSDFNDPLSSHHSLVPQNFQDIPYRPPIV